MPMWFAPIAEWEAWFLITLDSGINVLDEEQAELKANSSKHNETGIRSQRHAPKEDKGLKQSGHCGIIKVVVDGESEQDNSYHSTVPIRPTTNDDLRVVADSKEV